MKYVMFAILLAWLFAGPTQARQRDEYYCGIL